MNICPAGVCAESNASTFFDVTLHSPTITVFLMVREKSGTLISSIRVPRLSILEFRLELKLSIFESRLFIRELVLLSSPLSCDSSESSSGDPAGSHFGDFGSHPTRIEILFDPMFFL